MPEWIRGGGSPKNFIRETEFTLIMDLQSYISSQNHPNQLKEGKNKRGEYSSTSGTYKIESKQFKEYVDIRKQGDSEHRWINWVPQMTALCCASLQFYEAPAGLGA